MIRVGILTVSTKGASGERKDGSGDAIAAWVKQHGYEIAAKEFGPVLDKLRGVVDVDLKSLELSAEKAGAPWTPGRLPEWKPE